MATISLVKVFAGSTSYAADHELNYSTIEASINSLSTSLTGATSLLDMPAALRYIDDRNGIFDKSYYKPNDHGGVALLLNNLTIAAGAYWSGGDLRTCLVSTVIAMGPYSTGTLYVNVPLGGVPVVQAFATADSVWQFAYNQSTDIVTAVVLYSTCDILFGGIDYHNMLGDYNSVADRLAGVEAATGASGEYYSENAPHTGLFFAYNAGVVQNDNVVSDTAGSTVLLVNATTNYVELDPSDGTVSSNTTDFTSGLIPLFTVVTAGGSVDTVSDKRTWARAGGGGGGGHAQNTDTGTDNYTFTLADTAAGAPTLDASLTVDRGSSPDVEILWDETLNKWRFTNDGTNYSDLGAVSVDLATQGWTKYVPLEDPTQILELLAQSTDVDYVQLDLGPTGINAITDAPNGVAAVVVRVQFWDSAPGSGVNVKLRKYGSIVSPTKPYTVWGGSTEQSDVSTLVLPGDDGILSGPTLGFETFITASGAGTANCRIFLLGYYIRVTGVGTQKLAFSSAGNVATMNTTTQFNKTGFMNRGLCYLLKLTETGGTVVDPYDVYIYTKDTFLAADLVYSAVGIDPTASSGVYQDRLPFFYTDDDESAELHIKIINSDVTHNGTFTFELTAEQFA